MKVAILGASGGIGTALLAQLVEYEKTETIHATYFRSTPDDSFTKASSTTDENIVHWRKVDASREQDISNWLKGIGQIDWLINCVGMLHDQRNGPEKSIGSFNAEHFVASLSTNCLPTLLLAKHASKALKASDASVFASLSARVGSIEDNRLGGWYSYRSSKAALNMALKCLSIEWQRTLPRCRVLALHPGTTNTSLSEPFQKNVAAGKLFSPEKTARLLLAQIEAAHQFSSGRFIAFDGAEIPW